MEEIETAIKSMHPTKASDPDGVQALFYQNCWDIISDDVVNICLNILNQNTPMCRINKTYIVLIPKKKGTKDMKDFRPLSLCNVIYKIIAKILANRMKRILGCVISPTQSAFIPRRSITDNALIGFECIHTINNKRSGREGKVAMKLDMSKAYDRVE